jgi:hypothetical protein
MAGPAEQLPDNAGMNRFVWDLRIENPVQIPGAFYADEGPRGPIVNPGSYTVRMRALNRTQSAPLEVVLDPRLKDTVSAGDIGAHWDLANKSTEDIEVLHRTVNQMRALRTDLGKVQQQSVTSHGSNAPVATAAAFDRKMALIEEQLIQVNMKASEDNLRYPNQLNEQYDTFIATVDGDDVRPTDAQQQVYAELHSRLDEQLEKWKSLRATELPTLNAQLQHAGVAHLTVSAGD